MSEHLIQVFEDTKIRENKKLKLMDNPERKLGHVLSFKGINEIYFLHKAFIENDFQGSKGYLYKIGMVNSYYSEMCKRDIFEVLNTFTFPILSDSTELINRYLKYEVLEYQDAFSAYFGQSIQAVLKHNNAALTRTIEGMNNHSKEGWEKNYRGAVTTFQGILKKEKELVHTGIEELLSCHGKQNNSPLTKEYINYEATALVKLASMNGLDISIESQLIPKALLPVQELESYPRYDFFDELPDSL